MHLELQPLVTVYCGGGKGGFRWLMIGWKLFLMTDDLKIYLWWFDDQHTMMIDDCQILNFDDWWLTWLIFDDWKKYQSRPNFTYFFIGAIRVCRLFRLSECCSDPQSQLGIPLVFRYYSTSEFCGLQLAYASGHRCFVTDTSSTW